MNKYILVLGVLLLISCNSTKQVFSESTDKLQDPNNISGLQDDKATYVFVNAEDVVLVGEDASSLEAVCQDLFSKMAFNWSIVLSPHRKASFMFYKSVHDELHKCYDKFLAIQSADLYEKAYTELSDPKKKELKELFPFHLIETKPRK